MKAVIVMAERQAEEVDRLVSYINDLDGTEVVVIPAVDEVDSYPARNNYSLRQAAQAIGEEAFFWLEPDSIPLKAGWLDLLEEEYRGSGKEFMLSYDKNPPFDLIGGIGIYGPSTRWLIPRDIDRWGWDTWMAYHIPHAIYWSQRIQHSYGNYDAEGIADPHRFPRDAGIIRHDSLIFHRDKYQDIITTK